MGLGNLIVDCRPAKNSISPPENLVKLREELIDIMSKREDEENGDYFQPLLLTFSNEGKVNDRKI